MKRIILIITILTLVGITFIAFGKFGNNLPKMEGEEIKKYSVGEHVFYIPKFYVIAAGGDDAALLQSYYPGGAPVIRNWDDQKKLGISHKKIRIFMKEIDHSKRFTPEKKLTRRIKERNATKIIKNQYGLTYRTQPDSEKNDTEDLWIESPDREDLSFIECAKDEVRKVPHCSHYFHQGDFKYIISYDKRLLPEWQLIRTNVLEMIEAFKAKDTAYEQLRVQFLNVYEEQIEGIK